jgi:hypothetical protein
VADLIQQAGQHYEAAIQAQRRGDWTRYGEEMRLVGDLLRRLEELAGGS